jgi:hypothetical protein
MLGLIPCFDAARGKDEGGDKTILQSNNMVVLTACFTSEVWYGYNILTRAKTTIINEVHYLHTRAADPNWLVSDPDPVCRKLRIQIRIRIKNFRNNI